MAILSEPRPELVRDAENATVARWGYVPLAVAALAMVATLPGRTHGLGLITEPLLQDFALDRVHYAAINLWATLLGATFCVPWGWLCDRLGIRSVLTATLAALGGVVLAMSVLPGAAETAGPVVWVTLVLFGLVLLTRGLGQSALSVISLTLMGQVGNRRTGLVVGVYSLGTALGFMAAFLLIRQALLHWGVDWRVLWASVGWVLLGIAPLAWLLVRPATPRTSDVVSPGSHLSSETSWGLTLGEALRSPAFWVFGLATSFYGLIAAGISLFNQSILEERGFDRALFLTITAISPLVGLVSNLATGWLATRWSYGRLLAISMLLLGTALAAFPLVQSLVQVYAYAVTLGLAGGMVTTIFFGVWSRYYGPVHLGKIQGAAQMLTVLASAVGPLLLAVCQQWTASYVLLFQCAAVVAGLLALCAWMVPLPRAATVAGSRPVALSLTQEPSYEASIAEPTSVHVRRTESGL